VCSITRKSPSQSNRKGGYGTCRLLTKI
jgi:hypothetical protein